MPKLVALSPEARPARARARHKHWPAALLAAALVGAVIALASSAEATALIGAVWNHSAGRVALVALQALTLFGLGTLVWRLVLALRYRPVPTCTDDGRLPTVTVVVPAFNEGQQVMRTLRALCGSDYPEEKLQIIAIDDGSQDDTWSWLERARQRCSRRIELIRSPRNGGKRDAMTRGFARARGEILVNIDSDSEVEPATLRALVSPFIDDHLVGAVGGNLRVINTDGGVIPKMMDIVLTQAGDLQRASQSEINAVVCCPGAISAYRRSVVECVLDQWKTQTFAGRPCTIGEDRAMTNLVLRAGYHTKHQRTAVAHTNMPTSFGGMCKMLLRWNRSGVREVMQLGSFVFGRFREGGKLGARINFVSEVLALTLSQLLQLAVVIAAVLNPISLGTHLLGAALIASILPAVIFLLTRRSAGAIWAPPYLVLSVFGLWWLVPYAIATCHKGGWMTRSLPSAQVAQTVDDSTLAEAA